MKRKTFLRVIILLATLVGGVNTTFSQQSFCASKANLIASGECGLGEFAPGVSFEDFARHAIWLPFIEVGSERFEADSFVFDGDCEGMYSTDDVNGTAVLTGTLVNDLDSSKGFELSVTFTGLTSIPPPESPKEECSNQDPSDWVYYTDYTGTLTGTGQYAGYVINIEKVGPSLQVGDGANNKNIDDNGAAGWFTWTIDPDQSQLPPNPNPELRSSSEISPALWSTLEIDPLVRGDINITLTPKPAEIGDTVYCDINNNGVQDAGEPGIPGVTVTLECVLADGSVVNDSQVTDANGNYLFTGIPTDSTCTVDVNEAASAAALADKDQGICQPIFVEDLEPGESFLDADFCYINKPGSIGDTVYCDISNNGVQDAGEPGIPGVTVTLECVLADGSVVNDSQVTDANGNYLFTGIPTDSTCTVDVNDAASAAALADKDQGICQPIFVEDLEPGESFLDADFCYINKPGSIGDTVYCDINNNGVQDAGEPGIPGVTVTLECVLADGSVVNDSQVTDANGNYLFTDVPGDSTCTVVVDEAASVAALEDKDQGICQPIFVEDLEPGESFLDADFCYINKPGSIGDTVYCDINNNGVQDAGEPGIPGVTVTLECVLADGSVVNDSQVTDANGNYLFTDVPGDSTCTVVVDEAASVAALEDKDQGICQPIFVEDLEPGESFLDADFCYINKPGSIGDTVYCDINNNGVQDAGEPGIPGVTVTLECVLADGSVVNDSQVTDANGKYLFTDVPGDSTCTVVVDEAASVAALEDKDQGICQPIFVEDLEPGESFLDADFCYINKPGSIGDTVYCDINNNGVQDAGEPGIPGVTVTLECVLADGSVVNDSQVTDANGKYLFTDVPGDSTCTVVVDEAASVAALEDKDQGICQPIFVEDLAAR